MIGLENYYWYFKEAIPKKTCQDIIRFAKNKNVTRAIVAGEEQNPNFQHDIRKSDVRWLSEPWIYKEIMPFVHSANKEAGWNFNINWSENIQFTEYKPGQYYGWHSDNYNNSFGEKHHPNYRNKIRKISVTVSLSDPNTYEGGDFEIDLRNNDKGSHIININDIKQQGSILVFPSFLFHQVKPVVTGERNSLVIWNLGPPWN
jgi:PKHD-type hydroxylase